MPTRRDSLPPARNALASASALLLMGLLAAATIELADPTVRREPVSERAAVRQLTVTLAKAVRGIVGDQSAHAVAGPPSAATLSPAATVAHGLGDLPKLAGERLLRAELIDLPPPPPIA